jgi:NADPH:quinone reductase-like Zn-dependent oxidoreductase
MRAARVHAFGSDPVVEDVREPEPRDGETLVRVAAAPVAQIDLTVLSGAFVHRPPLPYIPGTEAGGRVVASDTLAAGSPVRVRGAGLGLTTDGTWRPLIAVPDEAVQPLPPAIDPALAAGALAPALSAYTALHDVGGLQAAERVAVTGGAGAVGSLAVQLALRAGAGEVIALIRSREKSDAVAAGARVVAGDEPLPTGVDLLIDTVGGPRLPELIRAMPSGARAVLVGYTAGTRVTFELPTLLAANVRLLPLSMLGRRPSPELISELLELFRSGELRLPFELRPLDDVADAIAAVRAGRIVGRILLDPGA